MTKEEEFENELEAMLKRYADGGTDLDFMSGLLAVYVDGTDAVLFERAADKAIAQHLKAAGRLT